MNTNGTFKTPMWTYNRCEHGAIGATCSQCISKYGASQTSFKSVLDEIEREIQDHLFRGEDLDIEQLVGKVVPLSTKSSDAATLSEATLLSLENQELRTENEKLERSIRGLEAVVARVQKEIAEARTSERNWRRILLAAVLASEDEAIVLQVPVTGKLNPDDLLVSPILEEDAVVLTVKPK